ncbi:hypothetical protein CSQ90_26650 [Janthinobacterium sp. BJB303]|nr:hypothetical protein CSQ90_26650 [Janthinobacterium sp. BJB303]
MKAILGFTYHVDVIKEPSGVHRGRIFICYRQDTDEQLLPAKVLTTPATFQSENGAIIGAEFYCREMILTGAMRRFLDIEE